MDPGVLKLADPPLARQRSLPSISWWQTRAWVIVLCQDRSRRRRWPKASLYKGLSPGPRSANRRPRWSVSSARMPKGDTPERTRLVGPKNEHTPVHSRERQGLDCARGGHGLISVIALHFLAGAVAGSTFTVRTLLLLVGIVLVECVTATVTLGLTAGLCSLGGLVAVQIGYLGGIYLRSVLERVGIAQPSVRPHHPRKDPIELRVKKAPLSRRRSSRL